MQGKGEPLPRAAFLAMPAVFVGQRSFGDPPGGVATTRLYVVAAADPGERPRGFVVQATTSGERDEYGHAPAGQGDLFGWFEFFEEALSYFLEGPGLE